MEILWIVLGVVLGVAIVALALAYAIGVEMRPRKKPSKFAPRSGRTDDGDGYDPSNSHHSSTSND